MSLASLNPKIEVRRTTDKGCGLFATQRITKGEWVWREVDDLQVAPTSREYILSLPEKARNIFLHWVYKTGDDSYECLQEFYDVPMEEWENVKPKDCSMYMNHSCDPTAWFVHDKYGLTDHCDLMEARRDIEPGQEITFDYATSEDFDFKKAFQCRCGEGACRGNVSPNDWMLADLQIKYAGHFLSHIARRIGKFNLSERWQLRVEESAVFNKYVDAAVDIPAKQIVMVLPPNRLLRLEELKYGNQVLQVAENLYSSSLTDEDLDNFICHSCDPNCEAIVLKDYTIHLVSNRPIPAGTPITIDYEAHEDDMVVQGVDFHCKCGASACRGHIVGRKKRVELGYSAPPPAAVHEL